MISQNSRNRKWPVIQQFLSKLIFLLALSALPLWAGAQEMTKNSVSNGAGSVSGGDYTGSVSVGEITSHLNIVGNHVSAAGFILSEPETLVATASGTDVLCFGGSSGTATVSVTGGTAPYTYSWSNLETTQSITGLGVGTYTVVVTDAHGCISESAYTVIQPSAVRPNAATINISCIGMSDGVIDLSKAGGGTGPYQYKLDNGPYQEDPVFAGLSAGTHIVSVIDANACETSELVEVIEPALLEIIFESISSSCEGSATGAIDISVIGGTGKYSYEWSWPDLSSSVKEDLSGLSAGIYSITVTDAKGCAAMEVFEIEVTAAPIITGVVTDAQCFRTSTGAIDISLTGDGPFTFSWSGSGVRGLTDEDVFNLAEGTYTVTVTSASGCESSATFEVLQPASALSMSWVATEIDACGEMASLTITADGGTSPYYYDVDGVSYGIVNNIDGLTVGDHNVLVTDANGCEVLEIVTISDTGNDIYEPNGSIRKNPPSIELGIEISARIAPVRDIDYYAFATSGEGTYILSLSHAIPFEFDLYLDSKTLLTPTLNSGFAKEYSLQANTTYYILVSGGATKLWSNDCYSLVIDPPGLKIELNNSILNSSGFMGFAALAYPNPHDGDFTLQITSDEDGIAEIEIFNSLGQEISRKMLKLSKGDSNRIDYKAMNPTLLFYRVRMNDKVISGQIISN